MYFFHSEMETRGNFIIRRANSLDDLQWVLKLANRMTRAKDAECYFSAGLTNDFFIGELNGERISCIAMVRHGDSRAFVSFFVVAEQFRGKGYGLKTWKAAFADIGEECEVQLTAVLNMQDQYKKSGFQPGWIVRRLKFSATRALESLSSCQTDVKILPIKKANFDEMFAYSADMMGSSQACKSVLASWLSYAQQSSWVAVNDEGKIVGYLIMSKTSRFPEEGYRVAPFFASSAVIAQSLLKTAVEFAVPNKPEFIFLDATPDLNSDSLDLMEKVGADRMVDFVFMGTKGIPKRAHEKVFSCSSLEVL